MASWNNKSYAKEENTTALKLIFICPYKLYKIILVIHYIAALRTRRKQIFIHSKKINDEKNSWAAFSHHGAFVLI